MAADVINRCQELDDGSSGSVLSNGFEFNIKFVDVVRHIFSDFAWSLHAQVADIAAQGNSTDASGQKYNDIHTEVCDKKA